MEEENQNLEENKEDTEQNENEESKVPNEDLEKESSLSRREELNKMEVRNINANAFEAYINENGISTAFQLIFAELITKKIPVDEYYVYTASRLRDFGREFDKMKKNNK